MFPEFNFYSTSLLILSVQGLLFSLLLLVRYFQQRNSADFLLAAILLITCYHQTSYTIGFMSWYDTYQNTKINYYLINLSLLLAPLIFFYIKSTTSPGFTLREIRFWHFVPILLYSALELGILIYDSQQPGFQEVQNGYLVVNFEWKYLNPILFIIRTFQMLLYLAFSFQLLFHFREKIKHYFANTYRLELSWLQNFLIAYSFLYLFNVMQTIINEMIVDLSWTQEWWYYLLSGIAIVYVGMKGYFTQVTELQNADFTSFRVSEGFEAPQKPENKISADLAAKKEKIQDYFLAEKPYLDSNLTLVSLAEQLNMSREDLSFILNQGFETRFNDFINSYRIEEVKRLIREGQHKTLSILGLAYEAGFNSKATFNRAFRKAEGKAPSEYLAHLS